jgi:hypothetical protein
VKTDAGKLRNGAKLEGLQVFIKDAKKGKKGKKK